MLEKILNENWFGFDVMVATPDMMGELGKMGMGRILGPKGLMPNPKTGTVTMDLATAISEIKRGKIAYRVDRDGNLNISIARCSFEDAKIVDNLNTVTETIAKSRPSTVKGKFIKSCVLHTTMGPGMKLTFASKN
jgi:large subunit ribosomal protein L1